MEGLEHVSSNGVRVDVVMLPGLHACRISASSAAVLRGGLH